MAFHYQTLQLLEYSDRYFVLLTYQLPYLCENQIWLFHHNNLPNLFEEREKILVGDFKNEKSTDKISIGLPRGLMNYYQLFPFWKTFLLNWDLI